MSAPFAMVGGTQPYPTGLTFGHHCAWCSAYHTGKCPLVKAIEYHPNGTVSRVEFHDQTAPAQVPVVPDELFGRTSLTHQEPPEGRP